MQHHPKPQADHGPTGTATKDSETVAETGLWRGNVEDEVDGCSRAQRSPGRLVDGSPTMSGTKDRETLLGTGRRGGDVEDGVDG